MRPNWALLKVPLGLLKFAWFRTLVPSARNSIVCVSLSLNMRDKPALIVQLFGPNTVPGPRLPKLPKAGVSNDAGLIHRQLIPLPVLVKSSVLLLPYDV